MKSKLLMIAVTGALVASASAQTQKPSAARPYGSSSVASQTAQGSSRPSSAAYSYGHTAWALPVGTPVKIRLTQQLSTSDNKPGELFAGKVADSMMLNGRVVVPAGSTMTGTIMRANDGRRIGGSATILLRPEVVTLPDGHRYSINAVVVDTNPRQGIDVDEEGRIKASGNTNREKLEIAGGAGGGAVLGAIMGGAKGTWIGALVGGGAMGTRWLLRDRAFVLPAGAEIYMELSRPMGLSSASSD